MGSPFEGWWSKSTKERLDVIDPMLDFAIGVEMGIIFPFTPVTSMLRGEDPEIVAAQTVSSGLATWLIAQSVGATIPLGGIAAGRPAIFAAVGAAPVGVAIATAVAASELQETLHSNIGMEPIPGSGGGYTNPMGGTGETYYPGKGVVDWVGELFG